MQPTNCPHCGAPAGTGFFCDACGGAMFSSGGHAQPDAPAPPPTAPPPDPSLIPQGEHPEYAFPGDARAAAKAYQSGGAGQGPPPGYPLPPGTVPYRPPQRSAPRGLVVSRKAFLISVAGFLLLVLAALGLVFLLKPAKAPAMNVPTPPGMTEETGFMRSMEEGAIEENFEGGKLVTYCSNYDTYDMLMAFTFDSGHYKDVPPDNASVEEMQDWIDVNGSAISRDFVSDFADLLEIDPSLVEVESLKAFETAAGDVAIQVELYYYDQKNRVSVGLNVLTFSKSGTGYMVMLFAFGGGTEAGIMNFLRDNITFK